VARSSYPRTPPAQTQISVDPLKGAGHNVPNVGQVQQKQRHPDNCVHNAGDFSHRCSGPNISVTWNNLIAIDRQFVEVIESFSAIKQAVAA